MSQRLEATRQTAFPTILVWLAVTFFLFGQGSIVLAQCNWAGLPSCMGAPPPYSMCTRVHTMSITMLPSCTYMNNGNGTDCDIEGSDFKASQSMAGSQASAFCQWSCYGGTQSCRIELSDGLPVELLEFSIDGGEADATQDEEENATGENRTDGEKPSV